MNLTLVLSVLLCICCSSSKKIPSYITLCHRKDPNLGTCFQKAVEQIRPHMKDGIPELFIPPMSPLVLPQAGLDNGDNFKASFRNIEVYYVDEFRVDNLNVDLDNVIFDVAISFPRLRIKSQYNIDGKILILQLKGQGPADGNFTDVSGKLMVNGNIFTKKGKEYIDVKNAKLDLNLGKPVFKFENLFRENRELNEQTNKIVNENVVEIIDELRPIIDQTVTEFVFGVITRIFNRFSMDDLFIK
ncbi:protein takeout-like [Tenebrio molitor]|uniref:protein takeout-like n=1 Tax=Tenebrio molitor TaxID=7067 RepID=UPI0036247A4A